MKLVLCRMYHNYYSKAPDINHDNTSRFGKNADIMSHPLVLGELKTLYMPRTSGAGYNNAQNHCNAGSAK